MEKKSISPLKKRVALNILLLIAYLIVTTIGIFVMRGMLVKQANDSYTLLAANYAEQEKARLDLYYSLLDLSTDFIADMKEKDASPQEINEALYLFLDGYDKIYETATSDSFAVIDGVTISNVPGFEPSVHNYDYAQTDWYKLAMEGDDEVRCTGVYIDRFTGQPCVTLVKRVEDTDDVLAFDVFITGRASEGTRSSLPENCSFYVLDPEGDIITMETPNWVSREDAQQIMKELVEDDPHKSSFYVEDITTAVSAHRNAYVERMKNGWYVVLTVPGSTVTNQLMPFYIVIAIFAFLWVVVVIIYSWRDYRNEMKRQSLLVERDFVARDRDIIEKTTESTLAAYRELMYIDLENDHMQVVYSDGGSGRRSAVYSAALKTYEDYGTVVDSDTEGFEESLSIENIRKVLTNSDYMEARFRVKRKNGAKETFVISVTVIERDNGRPISAAMAIRSMENLLERERNRRAALVSAAEQAESASRAKSEFLSRMSHDMRTPLNAIKGMTTLALMDLDNEDNVKSSLEKIDSSSDHLLQLINSVLDISKIESGSMVLADERFRLDDLLRQLKNMFEEQARQKGVSFSIGEEPGRVQDNELVGDMGRLREMLVNVIGNAVKFTPSGGRVNVSVIEREEEVNGKKRFVFKVNDTGIGMSEEFLEHLFEPYTRETSTAVDEVEGTGLGMPIALNIARLMGGDIEVSSEKGKGSKFRIAVYLEVADRRGGSNRREGATSEIDSFKECDFSDKKALLVDDVEINNEIAAALLGSVGVECKICENGKEALDTLLESEPGRFDIVFMDIQMPVMDGLETAKAVRDAAMPNGRPDLEKLPIVAMTANAFAEDVRKAKAVGMNDHVAKPLELSELQRALQKWL